MWQGVLGTHNIGTLHFDPVRETNGAIVLAVARTLNGVISVAQGTEVALEPGGVGVNLTVGQILDPVNDLIERFSAVMLVASSSLGLQNILLVMTGWWGVTAALVYDGDDGSGGLRIMILHRCFALPVEG